MLPKLPLANKNSPEPAHLKARWASVLLEAIPTINRSALGRLEGNLALLATIGACRLVHLARTNISPAAESSAVCHFSNTPFFLRHGLKKQFSCSPPEIFHERSNVSLPHWTWMLK
ncbi:hypothetical protein ES706_00057 [subsurface metagenome]